MMVLVEKIEKDFWRKHYFCLLKKIEKIELEYTHNPSNALVFLKKELIALSERNSLSLNEEMDVITMVPISSLCVSYIKEKGGAFKLICHPLQSEIYIRINDDVFEIHVFHKPFNKNPNILIEVLSKPHAVEIENYLTCGKIYEGWEF